LLGICLEIDFVAAGSQCGSWGMFEGLNGLGVFLPDIDQVFLKDAVYSVQATINFLNAFMPSCFTDDAGDAGINNCSGAAALGD